ncbi:MAG TPA: type VI secretion system baseplate subunit TssK [Gemmatimonadales bacterium]|nr:type VI secretion system baseplate subunit TssK [Gemmatimonadales bacterium]
MRQMQPVLWTKGALLTPQHLQTQDRFLEDQLQFQLSTLAFCPWGFSQLEINREALSGGALALTRGAGRFPDGLLFDFPDSDVAPPPKPLDTAWEPDQTTLDVFLAVPEHRPAASNVSAAQKDRNTRYLAEVQLRRDENTGLAEKPIQVARKNLRLLVEGETLEGHSVIKVARVRRGAAGEMTLDSQFVPPLLDTGASDYLLAIARRLVEILSAKSTALAGTRRQKNQSLAEFSISDVASFWLLYTINTHSPLLRHLFEVRRGHPAQLFEAIAALAGALTTFSTTVHPRDLPVYDHSDLTGCFTSLDQIVRTLLETVVPANCVSLPLRQVQPSVYATAVDQDKYFKAPGLYLAFSAELNPADLLRKVPQLVKVSSADKIDRLIKQALPGVALTHVPNPPSAIPVKVKHHYFQLSKSGPDWEAMALARNLAAYVPQDFPAPELELVIVLPQGDR